MADTLMDNPELEEWEIRYLENLDSLREAGTLTLEESQSIAAEPSIGTKLRSALHVDFGAMAAENLLKWGSGGVGTGPLGEAVSQSAATKSIENWDELSREERSEAMTNLLESDSPPDPLIDFSSKLHQESKAYIANKLDPSHKDYDQDYHAYKNWVNSTSIEEDGWFDADVMQKVILQGLPSLALSMTAGGVTGLVTRNPYAAMAAASSVTFGLEGSSEYSEAVDYWMDKKGLSYKEASQLATNSAWAYGIGAAAIGSSFVIGNWYTSGGGNLRGVGYSTIEDGFIIETYIPTVQPGVGTATIGGSFIVGFTQNTNPTDPHQYKTHTSNTLLGNIIVGRKSKKYFQYQTYSL